MVEGARFLIESSDDEEDSTSEEDERDEWSRACSCPSDKVLTGKDTSVFAGRSAHAELD